MSNSIFLLKEEEGFEERRKNTCGLDRWTDRNQRLYNIRGPRRPKNIVLDLDN